MPETNGDWRERMDRFERGLAHLLENQARHEQWLVRHDAAMDKLLSSQQQLLTAQVLLTDRVEKVAQSVERLSAKVSELAIAQKHTDSVIAETNERLNALIQIIDGVVRRENRP